MIVWWGLTNSWEKKRGWKQRRKGKIYPFESRVPKNNKEIRKPSSVINAKKCRKTIEQERLKISSRKFEIPREHLVLEKTLESPLDSKKIQPDHPKGNQSWIFIGRTDAEAETSKLWPPDVKNWLIWKDPDVGKDWKQEEKGTTEDEMVRRHYQLNGHELE